MQKIVKRYIENLSILVSCFGYCRSVFIRPLRPSASLGSLWQRWWPKPLQSVTLAALQSEPACPTWLKLWHGPRSFPNVASQGCLLENSTGSIVVQCSPVLATATLASGQKWIRWLSVNSVLTGWLFSYKKRPHSWMWLPHCSPSNVFPASRTVTTSPSQVTHAFNVHPTFILEDDVFWVQTHVHFGEGQTLMALHLMKFIRLCRTSTWSYSCSRRSSKIWMTFSVWIV